MWRINLVLCILFVSNSPYICHLEALNSVVEVKQQQGYFLSLYFRVDVQWFPFMYVEYSCIYFVNILYESLLSNTKKKDKEGTSEF